MRSAREKLESLLERGASAFDGPSLRYVSQLLARAEGAPEGVARRLLIRVQERLDGLEEEMASAKEEALEVLAELEAIDEDSARELRDLVEKGDFREALRLGRARLRAFDPEAPAKLLSRLARLEAQARDEGVRFPAELRHRIHALRAMPTPLGTLALKSGRLLANELSASILDAILSRSRGSLAMSRMGRRESLPEQVGPYNPRAVALRTLDRLGRLSPSYLGFWLDLLGDLDALSRFAPTPTPSPRRRR